MRLRQTAISTLKHRILKVEKITLWAINCSHTIRAACDFELGLSVEV